MTLVNIDIRNVASETHPDDRVIFQSPTFREAPDGGIISTAETVVPLVDGIGEKELAPGPVIVRFQCRGITDTRPKRGTVPDDGEVGIEDVIGGAFTYAPPVVNRALEQINTARDEALGQVSGAVDEAVDGELGSAVRNAQYAAETAAQAATSADGRATSAESTVRSYTPRVIALEAMGGLSPQSPVDGQTANLLTQPDTLTNAAVTGMTVPRVTTASQETATLGPELITSTGWSFGEGWSGDFATGFTKTPGGVGTLRWTPDFDPGTDLYLVEWKWEGSATHQDVYSGYDVYFGNGYAGITYQGGPPSNASYSRAIKSEMNRGLDVVPWESFEGRIHSISVRKVVSPAAIGMGWRTSGGTRGGELRFGDRNASSVFLGIDSGKYNYSGSRNAAVGAYSMAENVSGFFNAALGFGALQRNTNGTRNVAVGYNALSANTAGDRNIGVGPFALTRNTTGQRNVAVGTDVLWRNETGSDNVGIGYLTATELRTGFSNVAIGKYAMRHTHGATYGGTQHNIAIGEESLSRVLGEGSVAIGHRAASQYSGNNVVAVGNEALEYNTTAGSQTAIGYKSLRYNTGGRNTAIGNASLCGLEGQSTGQRNVAVGDNAGVTVTSGSQNTIIGPSAGSNVTSQNGNILIGFAVNGLTGRDNYLNIGSVLYGDLSTQQIGIGVNAPTARLHLKASTGEAGTAPIKINGGTLLTTPEVGALEFAGGKLYFTTSTGNRQEIAFVTTP